jgi:hypothetical protein
MKEFYISAYQMQQVAKELPPYPSNHGKPWTEELLGRLRKSFIQGMGFKDLCIVHGRSPDSVISKLRAVGCVEYDTETSAYLYDPTLIDQPQEKEITMSKTSTPLQNLTLLFGNDIKECSEADLISVIAKCQAEIVSFNSIPRNKWTEKRAAELNKAIDAAVAELDTRA